MSKRESSTEQEMGPLAYKDMVHRESSMANQKNLPFTFPPKKKLKTSSRRVYECPECGQFLLGNKFTYGIVCSGCKKFVVVKKGKE